jgi:Uma2 family endonuclease
MESIMATVESKLITAEEFFQLGDSIGVAELIQGRIVEMNPPGFRHGRIAFRLAHLLENYLETHDIGRISGLDAGVITHRDPDSVRGADVLFYSYARLPADQDPAQYPNLPPEIIWEIVSPSDRWKDILGKVHEYLEANVLLVCIVDPERTCVHTYFPDRPTEKCERHEIWREPTLLPGFELSLDKLFATQR